MLFQLSLETFRVVRLEDTVIIPDDHEDPVARSAE